MSGGLVRQWHRDPDDVLIGIGNHEIAVPPWSVPRRLKHGYAHGLDSLKQTVKTSVNPELSLYGTR